jgi:streptomycin 6-kinase
VEGQFARELERLARYWCGFWPDSDAEAMAADVEMRAKAALSAWSLSGGEPLGGGLVALVLGARRGATEVVLKLCPRGHGEEEAMAAEAATLANWAGSGAAARLLDLRDGGLTLLLERLAPGLTLDDAGLGDEERMRILGRVAARLRDSAVVEPSGIPSLREYSNPWRRRLLDRPEELADLDALLNTATENTVLHNDLHGRNVVAHRGSWVAIDPHGAYGDRDAEIWSLIDPRSPVLLLEPDEIADATAGFADVAGLDPSRAARWARLRAIVEAEAIHCEPEPEERHAVRATRLLRFATAVG